MRQHGRCSLFVFILIISVAFENVLSDNEEVQTATGVHDEAAAFEEFGKKISTSEEGNNSGEVQSTDQPRMKRRRHHHDEEPLEPSPTDNSHRQRHPPPHRDMTRAIIRNRPVDEKENQGVSIVVESDHQHEPMRIQPRQPSNPSESPDMAKLKVPKKYKIISRKNKKIPEQKNTFLNLPRFNENAPSPQIELDKPNVYVLFKNFDGNSTSDEPNENTKSYSYMEQAFPQIHLPIVENDGHGVSGGPEIVLEQGNESGNGEQVSDQDKHGAVSSYHFYSKNSGANFAVTTNYNNGHANEENPSEGNENESELPPRIAFLTPIPVVNLALTRPVAPVVPAIHTHTSLDHGYMSLHREFGNHVQNSSMDHFTRYRPESYDKEEEDEHEERFHEDSDDEDEDDKESDHEDDFGRSKLPIFPHLGKIPDVKEHKTVTITKEIRIPIPFKIEKKIPVPVKVPVSKPYPILINKPVPVPITKHLPYPVKVPIIKPFPIPRLIHVPVRVPFFRPFPVPVVKHFPVFYLRKVPFAIVKHIPYPVKVPVHKPVPFPVPYEKLVPVPVEKKVPFIVPFTVPKSKPKGGDDHHDGTDDDEPGDNGEDDEDDKGDDEAEESTAHAGLVPFVLSPNTLSKLMTIGHETNENPSSVQLHQEETKDSSSANHGSALLTLPLNMLATQNAYHQSLMGA